MALQIFIAHTGQRLQTDPGAFASLDAFKAWVEKHSPIAAQDQISLTAQGKVVRVQSLLTEKEILIYDRRIIQPTSPGQAKSLITDVLPPPKYIVAKPPDTISDQTDLQAWRDLFMTRRSWALKVVDDCRAMAEETQRRYDEMDVITRCVDAAAMNLEKHVKGVDQKNADMQAWAQDIQNEQGNAGSEWEASLAQYRQLPTSAQIIRFITGRDVKKNPRKPGLDDLLDVEEIKKAGKLIRNMSTQLTRNRSELGAKVDAILAQTDDLFDKVEKSVARSILAGTPESVQLMQDIEAIAKKVNNDYESILGYANTPKNVSQASKSALLHTKNFLPNLAKRALEMDGLLRTATETRNAIAVEALGFMHTVTNLTSMVSEANAQFASIELDNASVDAFHLLGSVNTLPVAYASFLAESIRRREWNEKVKADSSTLANEMAMFQDEELRRRRKWQKATGTSLWGDRAENKVASLEVNLLGSDEEWPQVTRQDLTDLLDALKAQDAKPAIINDVSKIISELDNPTKQQSKRVKAFKNGSIHEAALGRSALLLRGDDDLIRSLQEEKQKTESKLKTAESRVRRLEDLLHRQSQVGRTSSGNVFQVASNAGPESPVVPFPVGSPRLNEDMSRRSSVSSRRFSANQGAEEKANQQKLLSLEAELIAERERVSGMEKEVAAHTNAANNLKAKVEEASSINKDLMENFDAQQREFSEERRSLEAEIRKLKARLEEVEDELDRALGSRENARSSVDERVRALQDEFDEYRNEAIAEAQKAQGQIEFLRNESRLQQQANESLEQQLQKAREENRELLARAEKAEIAEDEHIQTLEKVYQSISNNSKLPDDITALSGALINIAADVAAELEAQKHCATLAVSDKEDAQKAAEEARAQITDLKTKLTAQEKESAQLRETLDEERNEYKALESELADERHQLSTMREKVADGETGSETLRCRLEEEERKVTTMSKDLASRQSHVGSLEEELRSSQSKLQSTQAKLDKLNVRLESRTAKAKDLTQRIYSQNDRLCRLLERLSYSVTREGSSMVITRIPRPERSATNDSSDPGTSLRRSISAAGAKRAMTDSGDLDLLYWMHDDDSEKETEKYEAYLNTIGGFDMEAFCETIAKRIRDIEYTAKKYSKDAKAYREKSHKAQKEAHEKIAFKNFKEGDLALFLPTRNQATGAWAAFNVGAPHYFLREQDSHKLRTRDWLLARIQKIEDRVVDLSKSLVGNRPNISDRHSVGETSNGGDSFEDDNPFDLSDGLRWYLIDATEEKPGAPSTPGLAKTTVASANIDATGSIRRSKKSSNGGVEGLNRTLSKSLDSRRSSTNSKKAAPGVLQIAKPGSDTAFQKTASPATPTAETAQAQLIRRASKDTIGAPDKSRMTEVQTQTIDNLMGP
ncbi:autophagy-related protein 11-domain-containing protein [Xylogone sp. PMI_703]|nr:autophagy-related protein 11-domain-containing protein [Xylogone sp. PMI_703]